MIYFANCKNRDHKGLFGPDAFFDLGVEGSQAKWAKNLQKGDICIVARYADKAHVTIVIDWYSFTHETNQIDDKGTRQRVLRGTLHKSESLSKSDASTDLRYQSLFFKNGAFIRPSVRPRT